MAVKKISLEAKDILVEEYAAFRKDAVGTIKEKNDKFFRYMRDQFDDFAMATDNQMRSVLTSRGVFEASNPRSAPKKGGKRKSDFIARLNELVGTELASTDKLTISDLELLIAKLEAVEK